MKLIDGQCGGYGFGGAEFDTEGEIREQLASYHGQDVEGAEHMTLNDLLEMGVWSIEK